MTKAVVEIFVMRGLDPRIHQKKLTKRIDCRVKPGNGG